MIGAAGGRVYVLLRKARVINRRDKAPRSAGQHARVRAAAQGARDNSNILGYLSRRVISAIYFGDLSRRFISAQVFVPPVVGIALGAVAAIYGKQLLLPAQANTSGVSRPYISGVSQAYLGYISRARLGRISGISPVWSDISHSLARCRHRPLLLGGSTSPRRNSAQCAEINRRDKSPR